MFEMLNRLRGKCVSEQGEEKSRRRDVQLAAYFDGELSEAEAVEVKCRLESDKELSRELRDYEAIGEEVREWLQSLSDENLLSAKEMHLWEHIEGRMFREAAMRRSFLEKISEWSSAWGARQREVFGGVFRPSILAGAAVVCALGVFVVHGGDSPMMAPGESHVLAKTDLRVAHMGRAQDNMRAGYSAGMYLVKDGDVRELSEESGASSSLMRVEDFQRLHPSRGLRVDRLDIDWIKADRPLTFVSARGRKAPPVIWVSNRTH